MYVLAEMIDIVRKRSSRRSRPSPVMDHPMKANDRLSARRMGGRPGARNNAARAGARIQISTMHARPATMPAVEAARISSWDRSGFWTSAEARPMRANSWANTTTKLAIAMSPKAAGDSSRDMVAVYARLATMSVTVDR